jgi:hypothetical protein
MQTKLKGLLALPSAAAVLLFAGCIASSDPQDGSAVAAREGGSTDSGGVAKVMVCHIPPGNPGNRHVIIVGLPAVQAHLAHGDMLGICVDGESDDGGIVGGEDGGEGGGSLPPVSNEN